MEFKKLSHCVYRCDYHVILATKYRREIFNEGIFAYFDKRLLEIKKYYPYIEFKEVNHDKDHVHMLVSIPPTIGVGKMIGIIKANLARDLKQKFPFLKDVYWGTDGVWSDSYFVSTVGVNEEIIRKYIERQGDQDSGQAKLVIG
jgi:putative transposase